MCIVYVSCCRGVYRKGDWGGTGYLWNQKGNLKCQSVIRNSDWRETPVGGRISVLFCFFGRCFLLLLGNLQLEVQKQRIKYKSFILKLCIICIMLKCHQLKYIWEVVNSSEIVQFRKYVHATNIIHAIPTWVGALPEPSSPKNLDTSLSCCVTFGSNFCVYLFVISLSNSFLFSDS